LKVKAGT